MLSLIFHVGSQGERYYALDPTGLKEAGYALPERLNEVRFETGYDPSEAYLLLPFSVVKRLVKFPVDPEDPNDDLTTSTNFYDHVILIDLPQYERVHHTDQEWDWGVCEVHGAAVISTKPNDGTPYIRTSGWFYQESWALDPDDNCTSDNAAYIVRFTDIRGVESFINGTPGQNLNVAVDVGPAHADYNDEQTPYPYPDYDWNQAVEQLWRNCARPHLTKFDDPPLGWEFPEIIPGNPHPINLEFQNMSAWQAFVAFVHKISHEICPNIDGTFTVYPIHYHTYINRDGAFPLEDYVLALDDPLLQTKRRLGPELSQHITKLAYLSVDNATPLIPYSFVGIFARTPMPGESIVFPPVYYYRSSWNQSTGFPDQLKDQRTTDSLFTQTLLGDTDYFPTTFLAKYPYQLDTLGADETAANPDDPLEDLHDKYVDMTFCWVGRGIGEHDDNENTGEDTRVAEEDIRLGNDGYGLRSGNRDFWGAAFYGNSNYGPTDISDYSIMAQVGQLVCKWHLRTLLYGDLGKVTLYGWYPYLTIDDDDAAVYRPFMPNTRHQTVIYEMDEFGPIIHLEGKYIYNTPYIRHPIHRSLVAGNTHAYGIVITEAAASSAPTGVTTAPGSYEQTTSSGTCLLLEATTDLTFTLWRPLDGDGNQIALGDLEVTFHNPREDAAIRVGSIVLLTTPEGRHPVGLPTGQSYLVGTPVSALDYAKGAPNFDDSIGSDFQILLKLEDSGEVVWNDFSDVGGVPGPTGPTGATGAPGAPGPTYTGACGILVVGTEIYVDLPDIIGCGLLAAADNEGDTDGPCKIKVNPAALAGCGLAVADDNTLDGVGPCKLKVDPTALVGDGLKIQTAPDNDGDAVGPCRMQLNVSCGLELTGTSPTKLVRIKRTDLIQTGGGLAVGSGTCDLKVEPNYTINSVDGITLELVDNTLKLTLNYTPYEIYGEEGTPDDFVTTVSTVDC